MVPIFFYFEQTRVRGKKVAAAATLVHLKLNWFQRFLIIRRDKEAPAFSSHEKRSLAEPVEKNRMKNKMKVFCSMCF